jgi:hypothetical protein
MKSLIIGAYTAEKTRYELKPRRSRLRKELWPLFVAGKTLSDELKFFSLPPRE